MHATLLDGTHLPTFHLYGRTYLKILKKDFVKTRLNVSLPCVYNKSVQQLWQGFTQVYFNIKIFDNTWAILQALGIWLPRVSSSAFMF